MLKRFLFMLPLAGLLLISEYQLRAQSETHSTLDLAPVGLRVDLLEHTDRVWQGGRLIDTTLSEAVSKADTYQFANILSKKPIFSWELRSQENAVLQTACQVRVASSPSLLGEGKPDLWDSGKLENDNELSLTYSGKELQSGKVYYWQVRSWNNNIPSQWAEPKAFRMGDELTSEYEAARYPVQKVDELPAVIQDLSSETNSLYVVDFERASFGTLRLTLTSENHGESVLIRLGEAIKEGRVNTAPGATIRYAQYALNLLKGTHTYFLKLRPDGRNTGPQAIKMPDYIGEVFPFRYCEIKSKNARLGTPLSIIRESAYYLFGETGKFESSNDILNQIWELCRYSMKATSFCGIYVDGDRERIPYEADALINQLSHYAVDNEYSLARVSHEHLMTHATWPTEWILQSVLIAWNDYLYSGDARSLRLFYTDLKAKTLLPLADEETLFISTRTGKQTPDLLKSVHYYTGKELRDIVDWPQANSFGQDQKPGESDFFVFKEVNSVVNAYHYEALKLMEKIATTLGENDDAKFFFQRSSQLKENFNKHLFLPESGAYRDGIGTEHMALHSSMFPMAFGMVPDEVKAPVMDFIRSRGMACSVYGSQFLMDAIYEAHDSDYALERMLAKDDRGWFNMIQLGSTITLEAWDNKYKNNLDWNHAWGAAPANIITRKLVGVEPLEAGFKKIRIKPQIASLEWIKAEVPSIRGTIRVNASQVPGSEFTLSIDIPAGVTAEVWLPAFSETGDLIQLNGKEILTTSTDSFHLVREVGSGPKTFRILKK